MARPGPDDPIDLRALFVEAQSARTTWRLHYGMPPNDPRVLDATDDEIAEDLVVLAYRNRLELEARNAPLVVAADAARDGGRIVADLERRKNEMLDDPLVRAAFAGRGRATRGGAPRVRLGGDKTP